MSAFRTLLAALAVTAFTSLPVLAQDNGQPMPPAFDGGPDIDGEAIDAGDRYSFSVLPIVEKIKPFDRAGLFKIGYRGLGVFNFGLD